MSQPLSERPRVPTITVGLRPHPSTPAFLPASARPGTVPRSPAGMVLATMLATPDGGALFEFTLEDSRLSKLRIPTASAPGPADGLWQHTCFEVFLGLRGEPGYREFNFSPSGQWAVYDFRSWRERNEDFVAAATPQIGFELREHGLRLEASVPAALLPSAPPGTELEVGLAAVIERNDDEREYWAVQHAAAQPDFHARHTFVLMLRTWAEK